MRNKSTMPYAALVASVFLWGGSFAAMRHGIGEIGAFGLMSLRSLTAAIVMLPLIPRFLRSLRRSWLPGDGKLILLTVLLQPCLYFLFESNALRFTTASQAGVVSATVPILTAVGAWIILKEPVGKKIVVGMVMAIAGIVIITFGGFADSGAQRPLLGNSMEFIAMICAAGNIVAVRGLSRRYDTWLLTTLQIYAGSVFFLPGLFFVAKSGIAVTSLPWISITYLGIASSIGAFGLYNWGMKHVPAAKASSFINLIPVIAALGAWLFLGEILSLIQIGGGVVVILGVLLSQEKRPNKPA
jgi:drug/metabolite transporter (DMT)-like permease